MYLNNWVLCFTLVVGYIVYSQAMNSDRATSAAELPKNRDKELERIVRRDEMPRMLTAIQRNDFTNLKICAERLIVAHEHETLEMALATAILCNNFELVRYLVEVGFATKKANVPQAIMLLVESRGVTWYVEYNEGKECCVVIPPIVHYLSQHFTISFD